MAGRRRRRRAGAGWRPRTARALRHAADPGPEWRRHLRGPKHKHVQLQLRIVISVNNVRSLVKYTIRALPRKRTVTFRRSDMDF